MLHIAGVLNDAALAEVRGLLAKAKWVDGRATAGHASSRVKQNRQADERDPAALAAGAIVLQALEGNSDFISAALPARIVPPLFNRYGLGEHYGPHIDGAIRPLPDGRLRTDLSATLFLSDNGDYDGGALTIIDESGEHRVRLPAGDMILYAASSVHHVEPITRGVRVAAFFWIQSLIRQDMQRRMLHTLDGAIQDLAAKLPEAPALTTLYGHYHNLLRLWAEP
jgi:PKHD-type hydroxylase